MINEGISRRGLMLVLSSPSGTGKTAIAHRILESDPNFFLSVSATTRAPRPGEIDGKDYYFVSRERFDEMVEKGELLEHAEFCGNCYGTPRAPVEKSLSEGRDILFDIEWQGTRQLAKAARADLVCVFILPPSLAELRRRLVLRKQDSDDVIDKRMATAESEISHWNEYDYVIVNRDLDESVAAVRSILTTERLKRVRQTGMEDYVRHTVSEAK